MSADVRAQKAALRTELLQRLHAQPASTRAWKNALIAAQLRQLPALRQARVIMAYSALSYEADVSAVIDAALMEGKRVALPRVERRELGAYGIRRRAELVAGPFGLREPRGDRQATVAPEAIDLILVPGVGFDRQGRRIGHGQGYYDRWLRRLTRRTIRVGVAFTGQLVTRVPTTAEDEPVSMVVSA